MLRVYLVHLSARPYVNLVHKQDTKHVWHTRKIVTDAGIQIARACQAGKSVVSVDLDEHPKK